VSLLTVVTVVKDDESGLRLTLASLGSQTSRDFTILVLDSSADRTAVPDMLTEFSDLPTEYIWAEPSGVYGAMNEALAAVVTPYTYFLNAGDELADSAVLARANEALLATMPTWAYGRVLFFSEDGVALHESPWSYGNERRRLFARDRLDRRAASPGWIRSRLPGCR
jgi:glycosyltransferase involved in cell wall biosynthesis